MQVAGGLAELAELAERRHRWQQLAELAEDLVYRATYVDGRLRSLDYVNPACQQLLGVSPGSLMADPSLVADHLHPDDRWRFLHAEASADAISHLPFRWLRPDGTEAWLEDRRARTDGADGSVTVVGIVRDITGHHRAQEILRAALRQQEEATEELARVQRTKATLLQAMSHEFRTPLSSLLGYLDTVRTHGESLEAAQRDLFLTRAEANARRLGGMIDDLLVLCSITAGEVGHGQDAVDLATVVHGVVARIEAPGHTVVVRTTPGMLVLADRVLVARAVRSLLDNAVRHTPAGTTVRVLTTAVDGQVEVVVEDDGPGLPASILASDFEPFTHGPGAQADPSPGLGLGLTLAAEIAALHGGALVAGHRPGGGARIRVRLPGQASGHGRVGASGQRRTATRHASDRTNPAAS